MLTLSVTVTCAGTAEKDMEQSVVLDGGGDP